MNPRLFHNGKVQLYAGDCVEVLSRLPDNSADAIVTDPPYHLTSIVKRFGAENSKPTVDGVYNRSTRGFMGKVWDGGDIAFRPDLWAEVLRVLKPGGHMVCFGGTRTYHRLACAIEDAGFEVRDAIMWHYGSGFPKSHDVSKGIDRQALSAPFFDRIRSHIREWRDARGFDNMRLAELLGLAEGRPGMVRHWTSLNGGQHQIPSKTQWRNLKAVLEWPDNELDGIYDAVKDGADRPVIGAGVSGIGVAFGDGEWVSGKSEFDITAPATDAARQWQGYGTALKPATEIICLARKPLSESTVAANVLRWGTGALNIDATRVGAGVLRTTGNGTGDREDGYGMQGGMIGGSELGRWPANLCHDNSPEVLAGFPETSSTRSEVTGKPGQVYGMGAGLPSHTGVYGFDDSGSAARFFYTAKADAGDRLNSKHPTVKPVDLMQWLVKLVCPRGATVLDPFAGTGTTGAASFIEGRRAVLIEREAEYLADIERRMELLLSGQDERSWKLAKPESLEALPLFALTKPAA